jgi:exopolysaccharide biosynthesis WecB/TagA/CpsF family protein
MSKNPNSNLLLDNKGGGKNKPEELKVFPQNSECLAFGLEIFNPSPADSLDLIVEKIGEEGGGIYTFLSASPWVYYHQDQRVRMCLEKSTHRFADGIATLIASRLHCGKVPRRITGPDFTKMGLSQWSGKNMVFIGGSKGGIQKITELFKISSFIHIDKEFKNLSEDDVIGTIAEIRQRMPDFEIIWLGIGCPKQEIFAYYLSRILKKELLSNGSWSSKESKKNYKIFCIGAALDFTSGDKKRAPKIMQKLGLEWAFRFLQEPKRLFNRTVIGNLKFLYLCLRYKLCNCKYLKTNYKTHKRILDIIVSIGLLIFLSPLYFMASLAIYLQDRGPIIYKQARVGKGRVPFKFYKFRSMNVGAEELQENLEKYNESEDGIIFKMKKDPRITPIGRFLRRWSIDELPQLFNVLKGQMSLVGPRPPILRETSNFTQDQLRKFEVKPGITGLWQVSGRSLLPFKRQLELDIEYINNQCLILDLEILMKTIPTILSGRGAY